MNNDNREQLQALIGDDYQLQWIIGHGGMSTVWLADDVRGRREVAIKFLRPEFSNNDEFLERFRYEATAAEDIDSDNVVATYDYREIPDPAGHTNCFIAMEYVRGESLADLLAREGSLGEDLALDVIEQAAHGLSVIHRMGLIHRDIKPGNLLITQNGQVKITDFGIAKAAAAVPLTRTGMVVGTAQYVSPEQAQGFEVTPSTDVYSLGVVGYEMLAGHRPFTGDSGVSVALAHVNNAPPPLSTEISAEARELIGIALRKNADTRFADGNELAIAASRVRFGERPPQPASSAMNQLAPEPSPTQSTQMLGRVAQPTTVRPEQRAPRTGAAPVAQAAPRKQGSGGFGIGMLVAGIVVVGGGLGLWGLNQAGVFEPGGSTPTTSETPTIVTEWVTPTEEEQPTTEILTTTVEPSPTQSPTSERQTLEPTEAPSTPAPAPTPTPAPASTPAPAPSTAPQPGISLPQLDGLGAQAPTTVAESPGVTP